MKKANVLQVRVTDEEFAVLTLVAKERNMTVSKLVREKLFPAEPRRVNQTAGADVPELPAGAQPGHMADVRMTSAGGGACQHHKRAGELCYKCDERFGYPALLG